MSRRPFLYIMRSVTRLHRPWYDAVAGSIFVPVEAPRHVSRALSSLWNLVIEFEENDREP